MSENNPNAFGPNPFGQQPDAGSFGNPASPAPSGASEAAAGPAYPSYPASANAAAGPAYPSYPASAGAAGTAGVNTNMADPFGQQAAAYQQQPYASDPSQMAFPAQTAFADEPPLDQPWYGIDFLNAGKRFFLKYATFSGRASRGEYWWACVAIIALSIVIGFVGIIPIVGTIASAVFGLGIIIPSISIAVRRLHDSNLSGWFFLIPAVINGIATVIAGAGFGPIIMKAIENPDSLNNMTDSEMTEVFMPVVGGFAVASLIGLIGLIIWIVLMVRKSNPAGARFDKNPTQGTYGM